MSIDTIYGIFIGISGWGLIEIWKWRFKSGGIDEKLKSLKEQSESNGQKLVDLENMFDRFKEDVFNNLLTDARNTRRGSNGKT